MEDTVLIRADASEEIGTGHVMRCLALADELQRHGHQSLFICRALKGHMAEYIKARGFKVYVMETQDPLSLENMVFDVQFTIDIALNLEVKPKWMIVDHYGIDEQWESRIRPYVEKLLVIDDLANRRHHADVLLDQNLARIPEVRYRDLVPDKCKLLLGPSYLLLRPAFYTERRKLKERTGQIHRLLMFFGGSDPTNETAKAIDALKELSLYDLTVDVVIGHSHRFKEEIKRKCETIDRLTLHIQIEYMAELIATADFALGAGGVAMWERCYLGLPSSVTVVADNQLEAARLADQMGVIWNSGWYGQMNSLKYADILKRAIGAPEEMRAMSNRSLEVMNSHAETSGSQVIKELSFAAHFNDFQ